MKQELLDVEVTTYNERLDEILVEEGKVPRDHLQAFIDHGVFRDVIFINVKRENGDYLWSPYTRTWKFYRK